MFNAVFQYSSTLFVLFVGDCAVQPVRFSNASCFSTFAPCEVVAVRKAWFPAQRLHQSFVYTYLDISWDFYTT